MRIWLDDIRDPKEWLPHVSWFKGRDLNELSEWIWVKTSHEAIALLDSENIVESSLDFDLGEAAENGDGYSVVAWIEERTATDDDYVPPCLHVHSSNLAGRSRLEAAVASIERIVAKRGESQSTSSPSPATMRSRLIKM
ncbi:MAG: hypothetical protein QOE83_2252 [Actinomycetota bacterium]|jgi:hypothetical protein|nr:hypothetical protein [Actinomycetota bacterium]